MSSAGSVESAGVQGEPEELPLSGIRERYKNEWVGVIVTGRTKNFEPTKGKVVADDPDRYRLRQKLLKYPDICIFFTGEPPFPLIL